VKSAPPLSAAEVHDPVAGLHLEAAQHGVEIGASRVLVCSRDIWGQVEIDDLDSFEIDATGPETQAPQDLPPPTADQEPCDTPHVLTGSHDVLPGAPHDLDGPAEWSLMTGGRGHEVRRRGRSFTSRQVDCAAPVDDR
jgi:hypothetical protein